MADVADVLNDQEYEFGFHDNIEPIYSTGRGANRGDGA